MAVVKHIYIYLYNCDTFVIILKESDKPSLREIIDYKIRDEVAVEWHDLGIQLIPNNLQSQLGIIQKDNPADAKTCCTYMFEYWLKVDTAASWSKLIEKLRHINQNQLAETISREILQGILT